MNKKRIYFFIKRIIDIVLSLLAVFLLIIPGIIIAIFIKIDSKGSIFFKQRRIGKNKKYFIIYKFRTMRSDTPTNIPTHLLENPDFYITRVGKILRRTSLDELPQIINILKGDMSIVGPRPALWNQEDLILERDKYGANNIRPGLTGLAQINGRDELEISEKAKLDGEYVKNMSFSSDLKIFVSTIFKVLKHEGIMEGNAVNKEKNIRWIF